MPDDPAYRFGGFDLSRMYPAAQVSNSPTIYSKMIATVNGLGTPMYPHHPLNCPDDSTWEWHDDEGFSCKHQSVPLLEEKLQAAVIFSITELIIELARDL